MRDVRVYIFRHFKLRMFRLFSDKLFLFVNFSSFAVREEGKMAAVCTVLTYNFPPNFLQMVHFFKNCAILCFPKMICVMIKEG